MTRAIVLTPQVGGTDGISTMSRAVVSALAPQLGVAVERIEVWSLLDGHRPHGLPEDVEFRTANGSRLAFASFAARASGAGARAVVLHLHLLPVTLSLPAARVAALLLGIEAWRPLGLLERAALRRAWRVAAISQHTVDRFRAANPDLADLAITVCHPGLDPKANDASDAKATLPNVPNRPNALIVGRMSSAERYKGHDELLDVWSGVRANVAGATLTIAGGGDDRERLAAKAAALGLDGAVRFEGVVSPARLAALYRAASVFVMPSRNEGFGLVYLEAMRAGTPCIAAPGAAAEIVEHGVTGLVVDPADRQALAAALADLLGDPVRCRRMGQAAAAAAAQRFSAAAFSRRLGALLDLPAPQPTAAPVTDLAC